MKALKTRFPCLDCGEPTEVRRLSDGAHARCAKHRERDRLLHIACWRWESARKTYAAKNGTIDDSFELAVVMSEVAEQVARAARNLYAAARLQESLVKSAQWVRAANSWLRWGASLSKSIRGLMEHEGDRNVTLRRLGFKVIDGGALEPKP